MSVSLYGSGQTVIQTLGTNAQYSVTYASVSTGGSFASTGLSVTITPQSTTSKIVIYVSGSVYNTTSTGGCITIYRNGTNLSTGGTVSGMMGSPNGATGAGNCIFFDSPASTSALTYTVYAGSTSGTCYFGYDPGMTNSGTVSIVVQEISGS